MKVNIHRWESGQAAWREEQRQERKQEIQNIRSRLFLVCISLNTPTNLPL